MNEKEFIVAQESRINQFGLEKDNKFNLIRYIDLDNYVISLYPKNRFIFAERKYNENKIILLYG